MAKLKELTDSEALAETFNELLAAHKELAELTVDSSDKLGFLC